ncbi:hypothetical protein [Weissella paramesenteroides]|uniref:hypothetical protein n=1 Tax=Weissella paramesenteroides TaxID=1249 RepID=UPI00223B55E2|nr:hypothetical protein [Weissella paramesenteroides]MCT0484893.1 hypothetical protein [Weissella paramesenteroides]
MKNKNFCIVSGVLIFGITISLLIEYTHFIPGTKGNGDWLNFWANYLGTMFSGLIAYGVARYQIQEDKKDREASRKAERLPYFNIDKKGIIFSTQDGTLPLMHIVVKVFTKEGGVYPHNIGHEFPNTYFTTGPNQYENSTVNDQNEPDEVEFHWVNGDIQFGVGRRMDISAQLADGRRVFYTYGNGVNGAHFIIDIKNNYEIYIEENNSNAKKEADKRVKDYLKIN